MTDTNVEPRGWLQVARDAAAAAGSDAGAVLVKAGRVVATGVTRCEELDDPVAVAEMDCIRAAGRRGDQRDLVLCTTRYPDMLVAGTVIQFSIGGLVIGRPAKQSAAVDLLREKGVPVTFLAGGQG